MKSDKDKAHGTNKTEAWNNTDHLEPETNVMIPTDEGVEDSKDWVEENEL